MVLYLLESRDIKREIVRRDYMLERILSSIEPQEISARI
jgi:hypothetical protein